MRYEPDYVDECVKCGKNIISRFALCGDCRKTKCKRCGVEFTPKLAMADTCAKCVSTRKLLVRRMGDQ